MPLVIAAAFIIIPLVVYGLIIEFVKAVMATTLAAFILWFCVGVTFMGLGYFITAPFWAGN